MRMGSAEDLTSAAIEDAYDLSPMQQGMLHDTIESTAAGMYSIVVSYRIEGPVDARALVDAWRAVVARHPILRTSFHWRNRKEPVQMVHREATLPVVEHDWRDLDPNDRRERLAALLRSENERGFDLSAPPLMRVTLVRCMDEIYELVVAHHHLLLDGSCKPLLFAEVFALYESISEHRAAALARPEPYRRFIEWLDDQNAAEAERFWREELRGFTEPTPLWASSRVEAPPPRDYEEHQVQLDEPTSERLRQFGRTRRLTLHTLVSGAWALLLAHENQRDDVVFGATVNARPPTLDGVEAMLGLFINTLPVRMKIAHAASVAEWLREAQLRQMAARELNFAALSSIQRWSDVPRRLRLFQSIVVFENNPGYGSDAERHGNIAITNARAIIRNSLPLTLRCVPARSLSMQLLYDARRFSSATIGGIADGLVRVLDEMTRSGDRPVAHLTETLADADRCRTKMEAEAFQRAVREKLRQRTRDKRLRETSES